MEIVRRYFNDLTPEQEGQFMKLYPLYSEWNSRINVISKQDIGNLYERHVLHSLAILKFFSFPAGTTFLDVGTGGGFPGIPLAIMLPECCFTLIDSIGKKIRVVNEVSMALGLTNVVALHENVKNIRSRFHFVVSRAVTALPEFCSLTQKNVHQGKRNGIIYLKGGDFRNEIIEMDSPLSVYEIHDVFPEPFFETKKIVFIPSLR